MGLRRALGWDYHRRRYWAFGSAAAAWRLYVESDNGTSWGWYDGEHAPQNSPTGNPICASVLMSSNAPCGGG